MNDIVFWERQTETLKDLADELKKKLLDWKAVGFTPSGKSERPRAEVEQFVGPGTCCVHVQLRHGSHTCGPAARAVKRDRTGPRRVKGSRGVDSGWDKGSVKTRD